MTKNSVFVVRNHENRYLTKKHRWRSGKDKNILFRAVERDLALNELIEVNARDVLARLQLVTCELDDHNQPMVEVLVEDLPEHLEEDRADKAAAESLAKLTAQNASAQNESGTPALELVRNQHS